MVDHVEYVPSQGIIVHGVPWYIKRQDSGEVIGGPFETLHEADAWHDDWIDEIGQYDEVDDYWYFPSCEFFQSPHRPC